MSSLRRHAHLTRNTVGRTSDGATPGAPPTGASSVPAQKRTFADPNNEPRASPLYLATMCSGLDELQKQWLNATRQNTTMGSREPLRRRPEGAANRRGYGEAALELMGETLGT